MRIEQTLKRDWLCAWLLSYRLAKSFITFECVPSFAHFTALYLKCTIYIRPNVLGRWNARVTSKPEYVNLAYDKYSSVNQLLTSSCRTLIEVKGNKFALSIHQMPSSWALHLFRIKRSVNVINLKVCLYHDLGVVRSPERFRLS